jgi:hypothetical protein
MEGGEHYARGSGCFAVPVYTVQSAGGERGGGGGEGAARRHPADHGKSCQTQSAFVSLFFSSFLSFFSPFQKLGSMV